MALACRALCLTLVVVICVQLRNAQTVSDRCLCPVTTSKIYPLSNITEFSVFQPKSHCKDIEVIVTLKKTESGEPIQRCLNTKLRQAKVLIQCWNRKNRDGSSESLKLSACGFSKSAERK